MTFEGLKNEWVKALKGGDKKRALVLSTLISQVKNSVINAGGDRENISEDTVNTTVLKELKSVQEQIDTCPAGREEMKELYAYNKSVIEEFAPKMLSEEEIKAEILEKFGDVIASGNKGLVMKSVMPAFKGRADGKLVNSVIAGLMK